MNVDYKYNNLLCHLLKNIPLLRLDNARNYDFPNRYDSKKLGFVHSQCNGHYLTISVQYRQEQRTLEEL